MENLGLLIGGFTTVCSYQNLLFLFIGVVFGSFVGVLPGLGPLQGIVLLIPLTLNLPPTTAIISLSGIYYGAMYGGSTTSILLNIPGESASVMTAVEGYPLAKRGRGGAALSMSAISSFIAGTAAVVVLMFLSPLMARASLSFGSPEMFSLIFAAFTIIASLGGKSLLKGLVAGALGIALATIGQEPMIGQPRLAFGLSMLQDGLGFVPVAIGLFAIPEVLEVVERPGMAAFRKVAFKLGDFFPSKQDFKDSNTAIPMGALVGILVGMLPGVGATISTFAAYGVQKRISRHPERFGKGSMEAVASVEGSNNAASTASLIPMLSLGIPGSATAAVLMGAMLIHGLRPGPLLFQNNPDFVWALIASMYLGNVMLLILNLPLIGLWISLIRLPIQGIITVVLVVCVTGVYANENTFDEVMVMFIFGVLGYFFKKYDFPPAPIVLSLILTEQLESALHQSLLISNGNWSIFFTRPISLICLIIALVSIVMQTPAFERWFGRIRKMSIGGG